MEQKFKPKASDMNSARNRKLVSKFHSHVELAAWVKFSVYTYSSFHALHWLPLCIKIYMSSIAVSKSTLTRALFCSGDKV